MGTFSIDALWTHSQRIAGAAKEIAHAEVAGPKVMDEAFVSGLLHDIGKLVLASNFPDDYDAVTRESGGRTAPLLDAERRTFGADHAEIGGYLLGLWGLPGPVVETIALHHQPAKSARKAFGPLAAVHAANGLVHSDDSKGDTVDAEELDLDYLAALGLETRLDSWRAATTRIGAG
jgi:HD-like signal output (HDOD) protein